MEIKDYKDLGSQKAEANNLKIVISNYYPSFSNEFTVLINKVNYTVKTVGVIPSKGFLILNLEPGLHKIKIQQNKSLMGFMNKDTIQEFELEFDNGKYYVVEYCLNQANHSSFTIKELSEPFAEPDENLNMPQSRKPSAGVKLALKVNNLVKEIGAGAGKIHNAISFKKKH